MHIMIIAILIYYILFTKNKVAKLALNLLYSASFVIFYVNFMKEIYLLIEKISRQIPY